MHQDRLKYFLFLFLIIIGSSVIYGQSKNLNYKDKRAFENFFGEGNKYFILQEYDTAIELYKLALEVDKNNSTVLYKIGEIYLNLGKPFEAKPFAEEALKNDKSNKYIYLLAAEVNTQTGNIKEAIEIYEKLLENIPNSNVYLFNLATLYQYRKDFEKALEILNEAEQKMGVSKETAFRKKSLLLQMGREQEAADELQKLVNIYPDNNLYIYELGDLYMSLNQFDKAEEMVNLLLENDPNNAQGQVMLAELYRKKGNEAECRRILTNAVKNPDLDFDTKVNIVAEYIKEIKNPEVAPFIIEMGNDIIATHPDEPKSHALLGDIYFQAGDKKSALTKYLTAIEKNDNNFEVWQNILNLEYGLGYFEDLKIHAIEAMILYPNQPSVYYYAGTAALNLKDYKEASLYFDQAIPYTNNDKDLQAVFYGLKGDAYHAQEEYETAYKSYEQALEINPELAHVLNNYSYFLAIRKYNLSKAYELSTKLIKLFPGNARYLDTHAWVLFNQGKYKEAKNFLKSAIDTQDANATIYEHYGDVLFKLGEKQKAVEQWQIAKSKGSTSEYIDKKIAEQRLYEN
ncbi:tetratricopeptide repeat protein [Marinigracilibium pacificum]|uniref:Tetratricopeptide repeat protein n=1 Tax=Marinigracilibium pacificum TaxID=2729599 RepID=A0A848J693_9BACT|nr:tetratricopeptide repeat protein [Marinigracilibium pacificum]NMM48652.1 tetratricopeptide repeat protein [Marinigracilibium pacificum]